MNKGNKSEEIVSSDNSVKNTQVSHSGALETANNLFDSNRELMKKLEDL